MIGFRRSWCWYLSCKYDVIIFRARRLCI